MPWWWLSWELPLASQRLQINVQPVMVGISMSVALIINPDDE
jgi:hypothetical protein